MRVDGAAAGHPPADPLTVTTGPGATTDGTTRMSLGGDAVAAVVAKPVARARTAKPRFTERSVAGACVEWLLGLSQEPGQPAVLQHAAAGLAGGAVVDRVLLVVDAGDRSPASRTRLAAAVVAPGTAGAAPFRAREP